MNETLSKKLHPDDKKISLISASLFHGKLLLLDAVYILFAYLKDWPSIIGWIPLGVIGASWFCFAFWFPAIRHQVFAFEVFEEELEIRSGLIFIHNTLVPMSKVQHVELASGPLMRKYDLAGVNVVTAATTHKINGLKKEDADAIKRRIGKLARVTDHEE